MTEQKQISNSLTGSRELTATMIDRTSTLNDIELDAVVGGTYTFMNGVTNSVIVGAGKALAEKHAYVTPGGGPRR